MNRKIFLLIAFLICLIGASSFLNTAKADEGGGTGLGLPNPLGNTSDVWQLIDKIIKTLRDYFAPPIVGLMIMYGAYQILFAGGSEDKFKNGKKTILYAVVGFVIIVVASGISALIKNVLSGS